MDPLSTFIPKHFLQNLKNPLVAKWTIYGRTLCHPVDSWVAFGDQVTVFQQYWLSRPSHCREVIENANTFLNWFSTTRFEVCTVYGMANVAMWIWYMTAIVAVRSYGCSPEGLLYKMTMMATLIARFMGPTWGPSGADRTQMGPMLAPWTKYKGLQWQQDCCLQGGYYSIDRLRTGLRYNVKNLNSLRSSDMHGVDIPSAGVAYLNVMRWGSSKILDMKV